MGPDLSLRLDMPPAAALTRLGAAINRRPKRVLGVLKVSPQFVGVVGAADFEIWERQQHTVHAVGRARELGGHTELEVRFVMPPRIRVLLVVFFALYAFAVGGFALGAPDLALTGAIGIGGAALLATLFVLAANHQRAELRRFVEGLFGDPGSSDPPSRTPGPGATSPSEGRNTEWRAPPPGSR